MKVGTALTIGTFATVAILFHGLIVSSNIDGEVIDYRASSASILIAPAFVYAWFLLPQAAYAIWVALWCLTYPRRKTPIGVITASRRFRSALLLLPIPIIIFSTIPFTSFWVAQSSLLLRASMICILNPFTFLLPLFIWWYGRPRVLSPDDMAIV